MFVLTFVALFFTVIALAAFGLVSFQTGLMLTAVYFSVLFLIVILFLGKNGFAGKAKRAMIKVKFIATLYEKLEGGEVSKGLVKKSIYLSLPAVLVIPVQYALLYYALDAGISFWDGFLGANSILFIKNLFPPITLGETGIREAVSMFVFERLSFSQAVAVNAALLIFLINLVIPSALGLYFILKEK